MTALQLVGRKHLIRPSMTYDKLATPSLCTRLSGLSGVHNKVDT